MRTYTPPAEAILYAVTVLRDAYDRDKGKDTWKVRAIGPVSAREIALELARGDGAEDPCVVRVVPV